MFGGVHATAYRGYSLGKYSADVPGKVRYGPNTPPNTPVKIGTNSIPAGTRPSGKFGTPTKNTRQTVRTDRTIAALHTDNTYTPILVKYEYECIVTQLTQAMLLL